MRNHLTLYHRNLTYTEYVLNPFKDEAQTALFEDPIRTAQ